MHYFRLLWPHLKAALEATYVAIEIALVGAFIAWRQLLYAQKRDRELDSRTSWEKIHKAMMEFRFRRELLNLPPIGQQDLGKLASEAYESLYNLKGQLARTPDSPLVNEIANFLEDNWSADQWRADAFTEPFDNFAKKAALNARQNLVLLATDEGGTQMASGTRLVAIWAVANLVGLSASVGGGFFVFFALTLKPSEFRLVKQHDGGMALCLRDKSVTAGFGGALVVTDDPCPEMKGTGPTAEVVSEHPSFARGGFLLIIAGFILQLPAAIRALWP